MTLTRSAARALLKSRVTIDKLPEEVLLEIFGAYRQDMELQPRYEKVWNSRNGWFKLAHVCRSWRRVVLSSPSHLHVHLLFTPRRSSRAGVLSRLPPLPILIDYCGASWTEREENLALAAMRHRSRVAESPFSQAGKSRILSHFRLVETRTDSPRHVSLGFRPMSATAHVTGGCTEMPIPAIIICNGPCRTCFDPRGCARRAARGFPHCEFAAHVLPASPRVRFGLSAQQHTSRVWPTASC
ncbi:hypothetical protein EDB89DRAFT_64782 [Lactarius sanguifluus]|nr:hypothetical protein EDB89DRAFT_64782 [Lactarius sanguifluus]